MTIDTPAWVRDAVFYQIFPDRFAPSARVQKAGPMEPWDEPPTVHGFKGGDLLGIAEHLDELVDLGITALYLTPIFQSASNHRYHTYDYFTVDPLLGGNAALRELLDEAHGRGVRVILDGVFNHTGRGFWPFHHVLETGAASPYRRWFHLDEEGLARGLRLHAYPEATGRAQSSEDPWPDDTPGGRRRLGYDAWWGLPALPKLNTDEPAVREYIYSVAEYWLRFGIDGWRLDVPGEIQDEAFWQEFRRRCRAVNPEAYLVGEIWTEAPDWLRGDRFDALMNYPLAEAILGFVAGDSMNETVVRAHHEFGTHTRPLDGPGFAARVDELLVIYPPEIVAVQLNLLDSHDAPRFTTMAGGDRNALRLAILLLAALPGAPCLYYGDEVGLEGGLDPDCRRAFPWDPAAQDRELRGAIQAILRFRGTEPLLRHGETRITGSGAAVAIERFGPGGHVVVAVNSGWEPATIEVAATPGASARPVRLPGWSMESVAVADPSGRVALVLPGRSGGAAAIG